MIEGVNIIYMRFIRRLEGLNMPKSNETIRAAENRRLILVVDDEQINRELLGVVLSSAMT